MSNLFSAINTSGATRTWNGMKTNDTSENPNVDLFFKIGSARGKFDSIKHLIAGGLGDNTDLAVRILLWARDVRGGAGERQIFRDAIDFMAENELITLDEARRVLVKIPELGRFDDLSAFVDTALEGEAIRFWAENIRAKNGLACKWAPRKGPVANLLRKSLGLTPKEYRKHLVANTNVVEQYMCAKDWDAINFSHVPSLAAARYQKAFNKNAPEAYAKYRAELEKPEAERDPSVKINANAVYPYDVIKSLKTGDVSIANSQWDALPDYMEGSEYKGILPLVDTSGSMTCSAGGWGSNSSVSCLDVAVSLGLYLSERNKGIFKDEFITFSANPKMQKVSGNLSQRYSSMMGSDWGMNTNVIRAFELIVNSAKKANLPAEDMPKVLLILSDMQFDYCARYDDSAMESITRKFRDAGYERPNVVFWNINSDGNGVPAVKDQFGTALVSGFSPAIVKSIIRCEKMTPEALMEEAVMVPRYDW